MIFNCAHSCTKNIVEWIETPYWFHKFIEKVHIKDIGFERIFAERFYVSSPRNYVWKRYTERN